MAKNPSTKNSFQLWIVLLFFAFPYQSITAQFAVYPNNDPEVRDNSDQPLNFPWTGGLNAVNVSTFDANFDGQDDLYIFDKAGNRSLVFLGEMVDGQLVHTYSAELSRLFPPLRSWALLRDYDCDGKKDLFTYSPLGGAIAVYRNVGSSGAPAWELAEEVLLSHYDFGTINYTTNIYCSSQDLPAIFDYDGDGDLDIITANVSGTFLEFHINNSVESGAGCGLQNFELANRCYGGFMEGDESNEITLDPEIVEQFCTFNVVNPKSGLRHVGSTILAADFNDDGLADLVLGDAGFSNLVYLINSDGEDGVDQIVDFDMNFPSNFGVPGINLSEFVSTFYEDVTGDGVPDLLASVNEVQASANYNSVYLYENLGTATSPIFALPIKNFLQNQTLDFGENSAPALFDFDGDGLQDLVLAAKGAFANNTHTPVLVVLKNIGSAVEPSFKIVDDDWLNLSQIGLESPKPTFGDLTGNGLSDLVIGSANGRVHLFQNTGTPATPDFVYMGVIGIDGAAIDVGGFSSPQLFDLNGDGLLDLLVGNLDGNVAYYKNIGTVTEAQFELETEQLGGVSTLESPPFFTGYAHPHAYRFEGETYLVCGSKSGNLFLYNQIDDNLDGVFNLLTAQAYGAYPPASTVPNGRHSAPLIHDWDGDGIPDLMVGGIGGGLEYFKGYDPDDIPGAEEKSKLRLWPNPAYDKLKIGWDETGQTPQSVEIVSTMGSVVYSGKFGNGELFLGDLPPGLYIVGVRLADGSRAQAKLVVSRSK